MLAYLLCYPLYGKSCASGGSKMSIHDLTSTSLATLASEVLRLENDVCLCRVATINYPLSVAPAFLLGYFWHEKAPGAYAEHGRASLGK